MKRFKTTYGEIPGVSDKEFFTNSFHVPVYDKVTPFEKIDIESKWCKYGVGGTILYVELDSGAKNNIPAVEAMVRYAMEKDVQYFAINVPNDCCAKCGYTDEINEVCPECGCDTIQRLRRVTGYLSTTVEHFNKGKKDEVSKRYKHSEKLDKEQWTRNDNQ